MSSSLLHPGVSIKPVVIQNDVETIISEIYGFKGVSVRELNGYDDSNYHVKVEENFENMYVQSVNSHGYVLKVVNSIDSEKSHFFEAQNELLIYLDKAGICCPTPVKTKSGQYYSIKKLTSGNHLIRLLEFIEGSILHTVKTSTNLFYQCGKYVAQLDEILKNFHHPGYVGYKSIWQMESVPLLSQFIFAVTDDAKRKIVQEVIDVFSNKVLPILPKLEKGLIHGDFNEQNILVEEQAIKGVIDFGDSHYACYVFELAITMTYMMIQERSVDTGAYVLAGYTSVRELPPEEVNILKICIASRLCQSLVLGAYSHLQDPGNSYILVTSKSGWALLEKLWALPEDVLFERWRHVTEM